MSSSPFDRLSDFTLLSLSEDLLLFLLLPHARVTPWPFGAKSWQLIADQLRVARLVDLLGHTGTVNIFGEDVQKLDAYANQLLVESLLTSGTVHAVVSEELEHPVFAPPPQAGEYLVYLDPIDGSSNIDTNCPIGTIFSLYQKEGGFLQQGNRQVASGYVMYGPSMLFVYTSGHGVQGFTLDLSRGCFVYSHPNIMIPVKGNIYSINEAYEPLYDTSTRAYLAQVRASAAHTVRYVGSLVADAHRTLLKGGHFSLSAHSEPAGRKAAPDARSQPLCLAGGPSRGQGPEQSRQEPTDHSTKDGA